MKSDDRNFSNAVDTGVGPRTRRQIRDGADIQVIAERGLGGFSRLDRLTGQREDNLVDEFGAGKPVEVCDSPQNHRGKGLVVIHKSADDRAMERIVAQRQRDGVSNRPSAYDEDLARFSLAPPPLPYDLPA